MNQKATAWRRLRTDGPLLAGLALFAPGLAGCPEEEVAPCATVTITADSESANNTFSAIAADQCDVTLSAGTLEIDILERIEGAGIIPRVLFTLDVQGTQIPLDTPIDLARPDNIAPEPAIYQEYVVGTNPAQGQFWTSNAGEITFTQAADGSITGAFNFTADNPSAVDNTAQGIVSVSGEVTAQGPEEGG